MPFVAGKAIELARTDLEELFQSVGYRHAGDEGALPLPVDGSDGASLPRALDEELVVVKAPLAQEELHLRPMQVKKQANRPH